MAAHVLPTRAPEFVPTQMSYGSDVFPSFNSLQTGHPSYGSNSQQAMLMVSPPTAHSDTSFQRRSSYSPRANLGSAASRDRTPIQHYNPGATRGRSPGHSRSEMLLAYAEQNQLQQSQSLPSMATVPSQSGSNLPHIYDQPPYSMSPPVTNYGHADDVFASAVPPSMVEQEAATSIQQENDGGLQAFYPVAHTSPHGPRMSLPQRRPPDPPNAPYVTGPPQTDQQALSSAGLGMHPFLPVTVTLESSLPEIEIKQSRPKPQCWDHGCNGRQFSTFSNLLRHQREKSGSAMKAVCPHCGTEFTRTTARNGHMTGGKCKGKSDAEDSNRV